MRKLILLIILLIPMFVFSVNVEKIKRIYIDNSRFSSISELGNSSNSVDAFVSGASRYGVLFNERDSLFCPEVIKVYRTEHDFFSTVKVSIVSDLLSMDPPLFQSNTINLIPGWNEIVLSETINLRKFYIILEEFNNQALPVSLGNGENCFYFLSDENSSYVNFNSSGLFYDLFVKVQGKYISETSYDVRIMELECVESHGRVQPEFIVKNFSEETLESIDLRVKKKYCYLTNEHVVEEVVEDVVVHLPVISPNGFISSNDLILHDVIIEMEPNRQCKYELELSSSEIELLDSSFQKIYFNTFRKENHQKFIVNFVDMNSYDLWNAQSMDESFILNVFSNSNDSLFFESSPSLIGDLDFPVYPSSLLGGTVFANYYNYPAIESGDVFNVYDDKYQEYISAVSDNIFFETAKDSLIAENNYWRVQIGVENQESSLLLEYLNTVKAEYYLIGNFSEPQTNYFGLDFWNNYKGYFYINKFETSIENVGNSGNDNFQYDTRTLVKTDFYFDEGIIFDFDIKCNYFILLKLYDNERLLKYVICPLSEAVVGNEQDVVENVRMKNYPNPFSDYQIIEVDYNRDSLVENAVIFNLKGQKIKNISFDKNKRFFWDGTDNFGEKVSSGIYFIKINGMNKKGKFFETKKIMMLK